MPYLGRPVTNAGQFEIIDDISSSFNGSNTSFTLQVGGTNILPDAANVIISLDGVTQIPDSAYSITGSTINFTEAPLSSTSFSGILAGQSQFIESGYITNTHISDSANISGSKINTDFSSKTVTANSGSFNYITASVIDTDASTIRVGGTPINKTLVDNLTTMTGSGTVQGTGQSDSPTFAGGTITGDFSVGGTITAQEIHTEFTSASIVFTSGSTIFGNSSDDVHNMTGSLNVSGAINLNDGNLTITDKMIIGSGSGFDFNNTNHSFTVKTTGNNAGFSVLASGGSELVRFIQESNDAGQMDFFDGGSLKIRLSSHANANNYINNGGNVGIGTNNPLAPLHINKDITQVSSSAESKTQAGFYLNANPTFGSNSLTMFEMSSSVATLATYGIQVANSTGTATYPLSLQPFGGNVGINTASPGYPLDIVSTINNGAALAIRGDVDADGRFSGIQFGDNGTTSYSKGGIFYEGKDAYARGNLHFALEGGTGADNADLSDARMTITYGGNVGIGTTGPGATLHVDDSSSTAYNGAAEIAETVIFRNKNGSDGSGVNNVVSIGLQVADGATSQGFINYVRTGDNTGQFTFSQRTASSTYAEHMRIDSSGVLTTTSGSAVSTFTNQQKYYVSSPDATHLIANNPEEYSVTDSDANYKRMKTFIASKSGRIRVKWEGYISSGTYWWSWRFSKNNGTSTNVQYPTLMKHPNGDDAQSSYANGLASGVSNSVHAYREFDVALDGVEPGDQIELWMRSSNGSGGQVTGVGQTLYAKNFEVYSDVPTLEENGAVSKNLTIQAGSGNDGILYIGDDDGDRGEIIYRNDCDFELRNTCSTGALQFYTEGSRNIDFFTGGTQRWSVLAAGAFVPAANNSYNLGSTDNRVSVLYTSNSVNVSDRTLKENIVDCNLGLTFINTLQPKSYRMKDIPTDHDDYNRTHFGLLAQDLIDTELSGSVFGERDGEYSLAYNDVIAPMIKAIQELSDENDSLKSRIEALES